MVSPSTIQDDLDSITTWAKGNCMNLNPKKCKEMRISFLNKDLDVLQLTVNDTHLDKVSVHKVLCDNLDVAKTPRRLWIRRVNVYIC